MAAESTSFSGFVWLALYFVANLVLTLHNKYVMAIYNFRFPWALTGIHCLCGTVGCYLLYLFGVFRPSKLSQRDNLIMFAFSALYTINIAVSNISLNLVTVPFHQVVRATCPVFTIMLSVIFLHKSYSTRIYLSLVPVIFGVALATFGDYYFTTYGFVLTVLGTLLAATKTIVTNRVQVGQLKLHPLDLLFRMSPLAFMQICFYSYTSGEFELLSLYVNEKMTSTVLWSLAMNGCIAFFLNIASFTANKKTSALTMTVAANVKQVLSVILAVLIFNLTITAVNGAGILITLAGGALYAFVDLEEKKAAANKITMYSPFVEEMEKLNVPDNRP